MKKMLQTLAGILIFITLQLLIQGVTTSTVNAQIFEPEGLNMPGSWDGWSNPPTNLALAGVSQTPGGRLVKISTGTTRWQTNFSVAASGGDIVGGTYNWLFTSGPSGGYFNNKWAGVTVSMNTLQNYSFNSGSDNAITVTNGKWYTMNWEDLGYVNSRAIFMETSAQPVNITAVSVPAAAGNNGATPITVTLSGTKSPEELVYIRYSTDAWATSAVVLATVSGTTATANIPGFASGTVVSYYALSSTVSGLAADYDLCTIKLNNNSGTNYTYTVGTALAGFYTIPGSYASLAAAVTDLNTNGVSGAVYLELNASYTTSTDATFPIVLGNITGASNTNTITIRPASGVTAREITSSNATAIFDINGGKYWIFDGRPGGSGNNEFSISNTALGSATTIRFINDASYNTLQYCTLRGSATTAMGVVAFAGGTTTGNDFNTISNCNITAAGTNLPVIGIYSMGSSASIDNSDITISNNNIYDYFSAGSSSRGIDVNSFNSAWTITGNSFYQTASRTSTTSNFHYGVFISNSGSGFVITNNYIGGSTASCGGSAWQLLGAYTNRFVGISVSPSSTATTSIQGNTVANFSTNTNSSATTANGNFCGILVSAGNANIGTVTGNTIGSGTGTGSINVNLQSNSGGTANLIAYNGTGLVDIRNNTIGSISLTGATTSIGEGFNGIYISGGTPTIMNNTIGSTVTANSINSSTVATSGTQSLRGINITSGVTTGTTINITGNVIANMNQSGTATGSIIQGIYYGGTVFANISSNIVRNITGATSNTTVAGGATGVQGILYTGTSPAGATISLNQVYAIRATNTGAVQTNPSGIGYSNPSNGVITRNLVYDITNASTMAVATTPPTAIGLLIRAALGSGVTISNNMISLGNGQTTNTEFIGIINSFGNAGNYIYHNTVNIEGTAAAGALPSFCFLRGDNSAASAINSPVNLQNNIFNNTRTGGTGSHYAIGNNYGNTASSATGWAAGASNYNALNSAAAGTVGYWNSAQTLAGWRTASSCDAQSISGPVAFANSASGDLHLNMGVTPTQLESGGITGTGITVDYDNQTRPGPAGSLNGGALAPDMGADEFDGVILDLTPPVITYAALSNNCTTGFRTLTATITDLSGVPIIGLGLPVCYWRINAGAYNAATATSLGGNQYQFTLGTGSVTGDVIYYYIAAQDNASTPNVGVFPVAGASGFTANPPAASTPPTTPSSYTNFATLAAGIYSVGAGTILGEVGHYPTLTAAVAAFNTNCIGGNIVFALTDATYSASETFPITINANPSSDATHTLTIKPDAGVTASISGAVTSNALIRVLNNYTTIDGSNSGGTSRDLTINSTSVTGPALLVGSTGTTPITNVSVKNCIIINGANTNSAIITSDATALGSPGYFNNITYQNNSIQRAYIGLYNNAVVATGNGSGFVVADNEMIGSAANAIAGTSIYVQGVDGVTVTNNTIRNNTHGTFTTNPNGVWFATGTINGTITNNTITDLSYTGTGAYGPNGILVSSGLSNANIVISGNTISGLTSSGTGWTTGVYSGGGGAISGVSVLKNRISNIKNTNTGGYSANGIVLWSTLTSANMTASNNMIWDVAGYGWSSQTTDNGYGIRIEAGGGYNLYHNSVYLATNQTYATGNPAALQIGSGVTAANSLDIRNNIFAITSAVGTNRYAVQCNAANTVFAFIDNNDYYFTGPNLGYIGATNRADIAAWRTGTGKDVKSISTPVIVSGTTLHLDNTAGNNWCLNGSGASVGVTTDIDNEVRGVLPYGPDLGADEFTATGLVINNPAAVCAPATVDLTAAAVTSGSIGGLTFTYWTDAAATSALANPDAVTTSGTYYIKALNGTCTMTLPVIVVVQTQPTAFNVTGGGSYCVGGTGVAVGLSGSETGVDYQLYNGASTVGSAVAGTGSAINFGNQTAAGTYTVIATNTTTSCTSTMAGSAVVTVNPLPVLYSVTGGGAYCAGGTGVAVGLSGSETGVDYQLYNGASTVGSAVAGTGSAISFGNQTTAGTYTVVATNTSTTCTNTMTGSAVVTVNSLPLLYMVTGGGVYCAGGAGVAVGLNDSEVGVNYQLYNGATAVGSAVAGTGSAISFGNQTTAGTYTVLATNASTTCTNTMTGSVIVTVNPQPVQYSVTGGGGYCAGGTGVAVGLSGSETGVNYQLYNGASTVGSAIAGTGSAISFGNQTVAGTYTVVATNATTTCTNTMTGSAVVTVNSLPLLYLVTGGGAYCTGGAGVAVGLNDSEIGVNYQLYNGAAAVGSAVAGTGSAISFGNQTAAGTYSVVATNASTTCTNTMTGSVVVTINPLPLQYSVTGGGSYCAGGTGVAVGLSSSETGVNYQLYNGASTVGSAVAGTGSALSFGNQTAAGTYTVIATNTSTTCTNTMTGSAIVTINPLPVQYSVTGGGAYCAGGPGVAVGLSGSETGVDYQLYNGATAVGSAVAGTGSAISFGNHTAIGTYTVVATNAITTCTNTMTGSVVITINPLPVQFSVTGGGAYCAGGAGVAVGLSGSETGVNYQLYNGASTVGSAVAGTGSALSFGNQTAAGTYTVVGTNAINLCNNIMTGSVVVTVTPLPAISSVLTQPTTCVSADGAIAITISGGSGSYSYNWSTIGGSGLIAGNEDQTGLTVGFYTVVVTDLVTSCQQTANFSLVGPGGCGICPTIGSFTTNPSGAVCAGSTVALTASGLTDMGVSFGIDFISSPVILADPYTGGTLVASVPNGSLTGGGTSATANVVLPTAGTVYLYAILTPLPIDPLCRPFGQTSIIVSPIPDVNAVSNQVLCNGANTTAVIFSGSVVGTVFNWTNNTPSIGLAGSGSGDIGSFTATNATNAPVTATITVTPSAGGSPVLGSFTGAPATFIECEAFTGDDRGGIVATQNHVYLTGDNRTARFNHDLTGPTNLSFLRDAIFSDLSGAGTVYSFANSGVITTYGGGVVNQIWALDADLATSGSPIALSSSINIGSGSSVFSGYGYVLIHSTSDDHFYRISIPSGVVTDMGSSILPLFSDNNVYWTENWLKWGYSEYSGGNYYAVFRDMNSQEIRRYNVNTGALSTIASFSALSDLGNLVLSPWDSRLYVHWESTTEWGGYDESVGFLPVNLSASGGVTCTGTPITFTYTVNPTPTVNAVSDQALCNGANTTAVTFSGAVPGTVYNWTNNTPSIGLAASGTGNIGIFTATNGTIAPVVATITVTPEYTNVGVTCTGTPITFTYTVNPIPTVNTVTDQIVCSGSNTTTISFNGAVAGTVYNWTNNTPSIGLSASGTGNIASFVATNATTLPVVATVTVTPEYTNAGVTCTGTPITFTITVNPRPSSTITGGGVTVCQESTVTLNGPIDPNYTYQWGKSYLGAPFTNLGTGQTQAVTSSGVYQLLVTNQYSCVSPASTTIVNVADYVFNGSLAAGDAQQTGRLNRFGVISTCAAPKSCPGTFTTTGARYYDSYTITNPRNVPVCATIGLNSGCGTSVFSVAYTGSFDPLSLCANYLADPGSSPSTSIFYEATIPANGTIVLVVHEVNSGTGCGSYSLTVDVPREAAGITVTPSSLSCDGSPITLTASAANSYLWTPGGATTKSVVEGNIGTFNYNVTLGYGNQGCTASASQTITISNPTVNSVSNLGACNGSTVNVNFTGTNTTSYNWTNTNPAIGLPVSGSGALNFTATNASSAPISGTITVTPQYTNGVVTCNGTPITFTITVNPTPTVNAVANQVLCNGANTTAVTFSGAVTGTVFNWTNNTPSIGLAASGSGNIGSFVAVNATNAPVVATITVTPSYTNAGVTCTGTPRTFTYTVNPTPTVNAVANQVLCNGSNTTAITFSGAVTGTVYNWVNNTTSIGLAASGTGNIGSFAATNATNAPVVATITVTPSYTNAGVTCTGTPITFTYTVNPTATVNAIANQVLCNGGNTTAVTFSSPTTGGTIVYNWVNNTPSIGLPASGTGNIGSFVATNATNAPVVATITVTPSYTNAGVTCTGTPRTFTYTVNPTPIVNAVTNQVLCNGANTTAVTFSSPTTGGTMVYNWVNNTPSIGLAASGSGNIGSFVATNATNAPIVATITVTPSYTNAGVTCIGAPITFTITVNPTPTVNAVANQVLCNASSTTAVTFSGSVTGTVFNWTNTTPSIGLAASGSGNIASFVAINNTNVPVVATITVTPSYTNAGVTCIGAPITFTYTVNPTPVPTITGPDAVCAGTEDVIYTTESGYTHYIWSVSNGGIITGGNNSNAVTVDWVAAGNKFIAVSYTNSYGCEALTPTMKYVTVYSLPAPMVFGEDTVCVGTQNVQYTTQANYSDYEWVVSAGGTIVSGAGTKTILVNWNGSGSQTVSVNYTNQWGCEAAEPFVLDVYVTPKPATAGVISGPTQICLPESGVVYTVPVIADADTYVWTVPAGVTIVSGAGTNSITVDFAATATTGVFKVLGSNECGNGASSPNLTVTVGTTPATPTITYHGDTLTSSAPVGNQWYKDGVLIPGATGMDYVTTEIGTYTVIVTINGCSSEESAPFVITSITNNMNELNTMLIQPNPNTGKFKLSAEVARRQVCTLEIITNTGVTIYREEGLVVDGKFSKEVDIAGTPAGVYMVVLRNAENQVIRKMIVTH